MQVMIYAILVNTQAHRQTTFDRLHYWLCHLSKNIMAKLKQKTNKHIKNPKNNETFGEGNAFGMVQAVYGGKDLWKQTNVDS